MPPASHSEYTVRLHTHLHDISPETWDTWVRARQSATPFMSHAYLSALFNTGCANSETGWQLAILGLYQGPAIEAACLLFVKYHSYGEYVFDWGWANAYKAHGLSYYPKLLSATPFTPVTGPRLLGAPAAKFGLLKAIESLAQKNGLSSAHILFLDEEDRTAASQAGWLMRQTIQFHWHNKSPNPYLDFDDYLSTLQREKRKKILQERRRVADQGIRFKVLRGVAIDTSAWEFFYHCYTKTYHEHGSNPYLTPAFFAAVRQQMPDNWLMFIATLDSAPIAASLVGIDEAQSAAFGRYWGSILDVSCLHFEACYYQPLAWCIEHGYQRFEGGAQGEHKLARGLMPEVTWSAHWLAHPQFSKAMAEHLNQEGQSIDGHVQELMMHQPFKAPPKVSN